MCPAQALESGGSSHQRQRGKGAVPRQKYQGNQSQSWGKKEKTKADKQQMTVAKIKGQDNLGVLVGVSRRPQGGEGSAEIHPFTILPDLS